MSGSGISSALLSLSLLFLEPCVAARHAAAAATTHTVTIENMKFNPAMLSVHRGDRIVWVNKDLFPHTVTSDNNGFDSGSIAPGASWTYDMKATGTLSYTCAFHPSMKGSMEVK